MTRRTIPATRASQPSRPRQHRPGLWLQPSALRWARNWLRIGWSAFAEILYPLSVTVMSDWTIDKFIHRVTELGLVVRRDLDQARSTTSEEDELEQFIKTLIGRELLTNLQIDRVLRGERHGFFFGKWKARYLIGTGSFARVYRATHRETGEVRAVKVLRKRYRESLPDLEQFLREGRMGAQLRHPNVVPIYEVEGDSRAPFMVMEFVEGENLRDLVRVRKSFDAVTTTRIIADVTAGLAYAAEQGITHRDLKMSNILMTSMGRGKLVDFGLAAASNLKNDKEIADCPNARAIDYAALERSTGVRKDDTRSDLFFTGCIMYHCLTGKPALLETKDRMMRLNFARFRDIVPAGQLVPDLPMPLIQFMARAMELDPKKRFQSAAEMNHEIKVISRRLQTRDSTSQGNAEDGGEGSQSLDEVLAAEKMAKEGGGKTVLIVESHAPTQDSLRDQLKKRGYRVMIMGNPDRVFPRFENDENVADCVVFSTTELGDSAVDSFNRFGAEDYTKDIPAILIVGTQGQADAAETAAHRALLPFPLKIRNLRLALHKLCGPSESGA